ncbi:nuclear pore complex protein Nup54-like isoform X2 [Homarus americanus]|uniref:nuclear pore complex protein Nup54-like isoform X2 n=1 Tax=Homarus americanus TaxID=6706 RepID=UPI001C48112A|nr:nuclear pore complex protein Nup54-like isoform X2 [Homarus americanus]
MSTFGFGTPAPSGATTGTGGFSFGGTTGGTATMATPFGTPFGTPTPAVSSSGFSFGTNTSQPAKTPFGFGTSTGGTSGGFLLGSGFGTKTTSAFGTQSSDVCQVPALGQLDPSLALHLAICTPSYFNNENDEVLRKWNQLQAFWGSGKGYYAPNMPPVEFTAENPYCRFKVVCYARIPNYRNENGIVQIILGKGVSAVEPHKQQIVSTLSSIFGGAEVVIDEVFNADVPDKTNIRFYVQQPLPNGEKQRAAAADVSRHMLGPAYAQSLKNLCIEQVTPMLMLTEVQMKEYLDTPQRGIDPALWEQGKRENPNPHKFVPVVKVGFQELQQQFKYQEEHAANLQSSMNNIMDEITQLRHKQTMVKAAIQNAKWKQASLTRRVLKLVSAQEVERKRGVPLDQTEEQIRMRLEDLYLQLMQPTQYRGCLNELMAQMSVKPGSCRGGPRYGLISDKERDVSQYVSLQHNALQAVVVVLKEDMQVVDSMIEEIQRKS